MVTHQDLLGYHNPSYHPGAEAWDAHRRLTRAALGAADLVVAFSRHVAADLLADDLVEPERVEVVPIGVDHRLPVDRTGARAARRGAGALTGAPFLLCLGTDLRHKNRLFALALLAALRGAAGKVGSRWPAPPPRRAARATPRRRGWRRIRRTREAIIELGAVGEPEKAWLYAQAAAVLYPTTSEGFGLIPFEAAAAGTPCLHAGGTSLDELLPGTATLVRWDAEASAERVLRGAARAGARPGAARRGGRRGAASSPGTATAAQLVERYEATLPRAPTTAAATALDRRSRPRTGWPAPREAASTADRRRSAPPAWRSSARTGCCPRTRSARSPAWRRRPATRGPLLRVLAGLYRVVGRGVAPSGVRANTSARPPRSRTISTRKPRSRSELQQHAASTARRTSSCRRGSRGRPGRVQRDRLDRGLQHDQPAPGTASDAPCRAPSRSPRGGRGRRRTGRGRTAAPASRSKNDCSRNSTSRPSASRQNSACSTNDVPAPRFESTPSTYAAPRRLAANDM